MKANWKSIVERFKKNGNLIQDKIEYEADRQVWREKEKKRRKEKILSSRESGRTIGGIESVIRVRSPDESVAGNCATYRRRVYRIRKRTSKRREGLGKRSEKEEEEEWKRVPKGNGRNRDQVDIRLFIYLRFGRPVRESGRRTKLRELTTVSRMQTEPVRRS